MPKKHQVKKQQHNQKQIHQNKSLSHQSNGEQIAPSSAVSGKDAGGQAFKRISAQKRNELNELVLNLQRKALSRKTNPNEQWQDYVEMQSILERIQSIESCLKVKGSGRSRSANIEAFSKWADQHGVRHDGVQIAEFPGYDLGLVATKDIKADEPLIQVPRDLIMSEELLGEKMSVLQVEPKVMSNLRLTYVLMWEKLNPDSFWKPYIDILPEKYSTVLYYTVNDMQELKGSSALSGALNQCRSIAAQYANIHRKFQVTKISSLLAERFSYDLYRWAVSTVMTRENLIPKLDSLEKDTESTTLAMSCETIASLIPYWDMANHKDGKITSFFNAETNQLESVAVADFRKGEQIFIYYGDRTNAEFLVHNGFVYPNNKKDCVKIKLGVSNDDELLDKRVELLNLLDIPKTAVFKVCPEPVFISPHLLAFVRIFNMNRAQLEHWIENRAEDLLHIDCALETSLETKTWMFLETRLKLLLMLFPTTLEEDEVLLQNHEKGQAKMGFLKALALQYRILEKRILKNALNYVQERSKA